MKWLKALLARFRNQPRSADEIREPVRAFIKNADRARDLGFEVLVQYLPVTAYRTFDGETVLPLGPGCWTIKKAHAIARNQRIEGAPVGTALVARYFDLAFPPEAASYSAALIERDAEIGEWGK